MRHRLDAQAQVQAKGQDWLRYLQVRAMTGAVCCWRAHVADPPAAAHRIRRIKCDEARPACERCLSTGRTCDGYPSVFRAVTVGGAPPAALAPDAPPAAAQLSLSLHRPATLVITADQVHAYAAQVDALLATSRPLCRLCDAPIDPSGHACPRLN